MGPVSHEEQCSSVQVTTGFDGCSSWSLLTGDQLEAVCQEAHRLASQLQSEGSHCQYSQTATADIQPSTVTDEFVQEAGAKLGVLGQTACVLSPIKRQTFCVQDSPMKQLPPTIQRQLLRGRSSSTASTSRSAATSRLSSSSPAAPAKAQPRRSLRGKATLGVVAVLPNRPVAPKTSCPLSKSKMEKTRLQPPGKVGELSLFYQQ